MIERRFCAQISREAAEPFIGTAVHIDAWLLLEYTGPWNYYAVEDSALPESVKGWIASLKEAYPRFRTQFIRQNTRIQKTITCFFVIAQEGRQAVYKFQFGSYEDLLSINFSAILSGHASYNSYLSQDPIFLVCTHGKHDHCCAKFGMPIYNELTRLVGAQAWQTSHVGGDKFAANLVCFPHGLYYARVTISELPHIVAAYRNGEVYIPKLRGRSCYSPIAQAADCFLRAQTRSTALNAFKLVDIQEVETDTYTVTFSSHTDHSIHMLTLSVELKNVACFSTCKGMHQNRITYTRLQKHDVLLPTMHSPSQLALHFA
ncbi:hypothetical protein EI42_02041 [Thermosporothrix hazakensis]|uniref:Sucrase/ferredoxin-like protein n=1 Tax=Thermosporothrix hazakensis TaxID=644383 RepID=A0A326U8U9_THEHA|nr:sucrase ferredoxin [Thermosporothrix hazakensis]PZW32015.1 hypothetical protein EI42_02041 [Thermosporothrix hazakensis]GCE49657.1 hypothetical protein KTH_45260 [Thermosporothrix hazakensis]